MGGNWQNFWVQGEDCTGKITFKAPKEGQGDGEGAAEGAAIVQGRLLGVCSSNLGQGLGQGGSGWILGV